MSRVMFIIVFLAIQSLTITADDPCRFETSKGVIDLSSLARDDGRAAFADEIPQTGNDYRYSYNPCRPFSEGTSCQNVAACQVSNDKKFSYSLGGQESATWNDGSSLDIDPSVSYIFNQKIARVSLECVPTDTPEFEALGETAINMFRFRLRHRCCCWDGCKDPPTSTTQATNTTQETKNTTKSTTKGSTTITSIHTTVTTPTKITTAPGPTTTPPISFARRPVFITTLLGFLLVIYFMAYNAY